MKERVEQPPSSLRDYGVPRKVPAGSGASAKFTPPEAGEAKAVGDEDVAYRDIGS